MPQVRPPDLTFQPLAEALSGKGRSLDLPGLDHIPAPVISHGGKDVLEIDPSLADRQMLVGAPVVVVDVDIGEPANMLQELVDVPVGVGVPDVETDP